MTKLNDHVKGQVADELGLYVYMIVDPISKLPFYIGKGRGLRYDHFDRIEPDEDGEVGDSERNSKEFKFAEIRAAGLEPQIWILRYQLSSFEYTAVEAAMIDVLTTLPLGHSSGSPLLPLTRPYQLVNRRRELSRGHGMRILSALIDEYAAPELTTQTPLLLVTLRGWTELGFAEIMPDGTHRSGNGYKHEWLTSEERIKHFTEIGISVSGYWTINPGRVESSGIEHAVAVHRGNDKGPFQDCSRKLGQEYG